MPSVKGSYRTPFWASMETKDKGTWFASYAKQWVEVRVSSAGDNEVFLCLSPEQGAPTTEELSLVGGASVNCKPVAKHPNYIELTFAPPKKRTMKIKCTAASDMTDLLAVLQQNVKGLTLVRE
jgi:hypothetical protein